MAPLNVSLPVEEDIYRILLVNSRGYYKFQVEIGAATNQDFNIEIVCKA